MTMGSVVPLIVTDTIANYFHFCIAHFHCKYRVAVLSNSIDLLSALVGANALMEQVAG